MDNKNVFDEVVEKLLNYTDLTKEDITLKSRLDFDLGLTSFDFMCLITALKECYGIEVDNSVIQKVSKVEDLCYLIQNSTLRKEDCLDEKIYTR